MANILDPMDLKQIITLHLDGSSNRRIGSILGISRNTVNTYIQLFAASDFSMEVENPYSYTQFLEHFRRKYPKEQGSMKLDHVAGEELFIDFAGEKLHIIDKATGEVIPVEVFIAILPCSQYTYVQVCRSQKRGDLIACCVNALRFFGGVPKAIVSDNLSSAVSRASKYEPDINRSFKDFARHYNCVINPTRTYSPQDKALVENAVHLAYQRIYYPMREMTFFSLEDLNKEISRLLQRYNTLLFQRKEASRIELYQRVERQYLKKLPVAAYELKDYKRAKVQKMGYVYFSPDKSYYSVPYRYIGKETSIHYTKSRVEVFYNQERIAMHQRNLARGSYITNTDHLSSTHKFYSDWNPEFFKKKAVQHGEHVLSCVEKILVAQDYPEIGYKRALGVIQLYRSYGSQRLNDACKRALETDACSYNRIKNILKNNMDKVPLPSDLLETSEPHIPFHSNIRGASAYE